ncbi:uncharacterized protein LOC125043321 isoform X1 [Penaeus chinensis]|uniref:uncharacterized protein LOC125043321 isoform X1 n=1 Tax=Penaeus chinensis TaxID=139456 RepID=UPI001FB74CF7|nr:uncharacterized protein LOC125043321 isoform X1 [Penaeus chinensis]
MTVTTSRRTRLSLLHIVPSLVGLLAATVAWSSVGADGRYVLINLTVHNSGDMNIYKTFQTDEENLKRFNLTAEDMSKGNVNLNSHGEVDEIEVKGQTIPLHLDLRKELEGLTYSYLTVDNKTWSVRVGDFNNITLDDFKDDPNLVPENVTLDWSLLPAYNPNPANISLKSAVMEASIHFDNNTLLFQYLEGEVKVGKWVPILPYTGLHLRVINPHTRQLTFSKYYSTDYFMDQEFLENLQNLKNGRIAIVASFYDVTGHFESPVKDALEEFGSFAVQHLKFRDPWAWVWQAGGATLAEGLVTNRNGVETLPPPLYLSLQMPAVNATERFCKDWPTGGTWEKRKHFCDIYDGYGDLCSCDNPFSTNTATPRWRHGVRILASCW